MDVLTTRPDPSNRVKAVALVKTTMPASARSRGESPSFVSGGSIPSTLSKFPKLKAILFVHPLQAKLHLFKEIESRMVQGVSFPFTYSDVSDALAQLEPLVNGVPLVHTRPTHS